MDSALHRTFRLLPSERVLWHGGPKLGVAREGFWFWVPALLFSLAAVVALFAGLIAVAGIPALRPTVLLAFYFLVSACGFALAPRHLLDPCEYLVTDRHVIWKRGQVRRLMPRKMITYARIHWHKSSPGVGDLELVRAAPFGPFSRKQRVTLHDVEAPDRLFALIRNAEPAQFAGYGDVQLSDRLDKGERVLWGASPLGFRLGHSELLMASFGVLVLCAGAVYAYRTGHVLVTLEGLGLPVRSATWVMLFLAIVTSGTVMLSVGAALLWHGLWGARAEGSSTEYILTDSRVLIRRGRTELSIDRRCIVDVAEQPSTGDLGNLYLILGGPRTRVSDDSGAQALLSPARALVAPVLYEVRDRELFRRLLFAAVEEKPEPPVRDAA